MRPLRLAVYGHLNRDGGSGPGSNCLLVERLLRDGHAVDLYAISGFVGPGDLHRFERLTYYAVSIPAVDRAFSFCHRRLPQPLGWPLAFALNKARHWLYYRKISRLINENHGREPYDGLLVLDLLMPFKRNPTLFCANWPQSTPLGELEGIRSQKEQIIRLCGRRYYWSLVLYYKFKVWTVGRSIRECDRVLCCSSWTADSWGKLGVEADAIPFALDLDVFRPAPDLTRKPGPVCFLHLGRLVPRKRLDLLLEGFYLVRQEDPDVKLLIVGRVAYPKGYESLLAPGRLPEGVEHIPFVPRASVPDLVRGVDVLVQPSENEDFGSAVMEAQACGVPVVLGPTNGTRDFISPRSFVFEEYSARAVKEAMSRAAAEVRGDRPGLAVAARRAAEANFSVEELAGRVVRIVREGRDADRRPVRDRAELQRS